MQSNEPLLSKMILVYVGAAGIGYSAHSNETRCCALHVPVLYLLESHFASLDIRLTG